MILQQIILSTLLCGFAQPFDDNDHAQPYGGNQVSLRVDAHEAGTEHFDLKHSYQLHGLKMKSVPSGLKNFKLYILKVGSIDEKAIIGNVWDDKSLEWVVLDLTWTEKRSISCDQLAQIMWFRKPNGDVFVPEVEFIVLSRILKSYSNVRLMDVDPDTRKYDIDLRDMWNLIDGSNETSFRTQKHQKISFEVRGLKTRRVVEVRIFAKALGEYSRESPKKENSIEKIYNAKSLRSHDHHKRRSVGIKRDQYFVDIDEDSDDSVPNEGGEINDLNNPALTLTVETRRSGTISNNNNGIRSDDDVSSDGNNDDDSDGLPLALRWHETLQCFVAVLSHKVQEGGTSGFHLRFGDVEYDFNRIEFLLPESPTFADARISHVRGTSSVIGSNARNIIDGKGETNWICASSTKCEVEIKFQKPTQLRHASITVSQDPRNVFQSFMKDFSIKSSTAGGIWRVHRYYWNNRKRGEHKNTQAFETNFVAQSVKFVVDMNEVGSNFQTSIQSINFYAQPQPSVCETFPRPCLQQGTAYCHSNSFGGAKCTCRRGWNLTSTRQSHSSVEPIQCGTYHPCQLKNGGCTHESECVEHTDGKLECRCLYDYTGDNCEIDPPTGICSSNLCKNMGTCIPLSNSKEYKCSCEKGFAGAHCQTEIEGLCVVEADHDNSVGVSKANLTLDETVVFTCKRGFGMLSLDDDDNDEYNDERDAGNVGPSNEDTQSGEYHVAEFRPVYAHSVSKKCTEEKYLIHAPKCHSIPDYCQSAQSSLGLEITPQSAALFSMVKYQANSGYELYRGDRKIDSGHIELRCQEDTYAEGSTHDSLIISQTNPSYCEVSMTHGLAASEKSVALGETVQFSCLSGFHDIPVVTLECGVGTQQKGDFSGEQPVCFASQEEDSRDESELNPRYSGTNHVQVAGLDEPLLYFSGVFEQVGMHRFDCDLSNNKGDSAALAFNGSTFSPPIFISVEIPQKTISAHFRYWFYVSEENLNKTVYARKSTYSSSMTNAKVRTRDALLNGFERTAEVSSGCEGIWCLDTKSYNAKNAALETLKGFCCA